jgi:hypothetical protein
MDSHGISSPKSVEKTRKELDTSVMYHNAKRKHGTDINNEVYQVPGDFRKYQEGYENIEWDKDDNNGEEAAGVLLFVAALYVIIVRRRIF